MLELRGEAGIATSNPPGGDDSRARNRRQLAGLEGVVRNEILPRLLHAHARATTPHAGAAAPVERLARALIDDDEHLARKVFARLSAASGDERRLLYDLLAPAARRIGDWWREDVCDFFTVSQGMARLRALLAQISAPVGDEALAPSMLMLTPPNETHRFGAEMAADLFRREGWRVERADGDLTALRGQAFDAVALSCGCEQAAQGLPQFIERIRSQTRASRTPVLLGGALFLDNSARGQNFGVDFVASDHEVFRRFSRSLLKPRRQ